MLQHRKASLRSCLGVVSLMFLALLFAIFVPGTGYTQDLAVDTASEQPAVVRLVFQPEKTWTPSTSREGEAFRARLSEDVRSLDRGNILFSKGAWVLGRITKVSDSSKSRRLPRIPIPLLPRKISEPKPSFVVVTLGYLIDTDGEVFLFRADLQAESFSPEAEMALEQDLNEMHAIFD